MTLTDQDVAIFVEHLSNRNSKAAAQFALQFLDAGVSARELLPGLIGRAQAIIGEKWQRNELTIADEHAATAVSDAVLSVLTALGNPRANGPHVVVCCAEGEWHLLAARLLTEVLRADGAVVTFLGASMPAAHLGRFLDEAQADVLAVSCSTALSFAGVAGHVLVARDHNVPVIAGGRGLGPDDRRALALGADAWAPTAAAAADLLRRPLRQRTSEPPPLGDLAELMLVSEDVVRAATAELVQRDHRFSRLSPTQLERVREDFGYILRFAEAAELVGDHRLFDEFIVWLEEVLTTRGLPPGTVSESLAVLADVARPWPIVSRLLEAA